MKEHAKKCASWGRAVSLCDCDSYHTFAELYDHRIAIYIALCQSLVTLDGLQEAMGQKKLYHVWRSHLHSDGTSFANWFTLGIYKEAGKQITYHLPNSRWDDVAFAETLDRGPEFDGHTPEDVLLRLKDL